MALRMNLVGVLVVVAIFLSVIPDNAYGHDVADAPSSDSPAEAPLPEVNGEKDDQDVFSDYYDDENQPSISTTLSLQVIPNFVDDSPSVASPPGPTDETDEANGDDDSSPDASATGETDEANGDADNAKDDSSDKTDDADDAQGDDGESLGRKLLQKGFF